MKHRAFFTVLSAIFLHVHQQAGAQSAGQTPALAWSGYAEVYYAYDFSRPADHERPPFVYSHDRHGEVTLNFGYLKAAYQREGIRAALALAAGTYVNANYSAEPGVIKNVFEANAGVRLSKKNSLWFDAGVFSSHIGFESAVGKDCWTLTRSLAAENTPYYESGARLSYTSPDERWQLAALYLNGWQRIQRPETNSAPALGTQVTFLPTPDITLNSSTFAGSDYPDSARLTRIFHNLYGIFRLGASWSAIVGLDYGVEQQHPERSSFNHWINPTLIVRRILSPRFRAAARAEYYRDPAGVIIRTGTTGGFRTLGLSANLDFFPADNALCRIEGRLFSSSDRIFGQGAAASRYNVCLTTALCIAF